MPIASSTRSGPDRGQRYLLPRSSRVVTAGDFRRIYRRGLRAHGRELVVVARPRRQGGHRLGVSVSKAHGPAVRRNKIKRLLREAFRLERPELPGHFDVILIPRQKPGKYRLEDLRRELRRLLSKVFEGKGKKAKG